MPPLKGEDTCEHVERVSAIAWSNGAYKATEALKADNARLKAEVERLSKPAIIGGYNISEYIRMANSETLEFDNGDIFADMTLLERIKYIVESHARLKAEVEVWKEMVADSGVACNERAGENQDLENQIERLKAEVERLTKERDKALTDFWYIHEGYFRLQAEVNRLTAFTTRTIIPNKELQAQVERLTKAGDAMAVHLAGCYRSEGYDPKNCRAIDIWNAAKEGKPRA